MCMQSTVLFVRPICIIYLGLERVTDIGWYKLAKGTKKTNGSCLRLISHCIRPPRLPTKGWHKRTHPEEIP
jgi:hypothetical protein